jgi:hypothetical protein
MWVWATFAFLIPAIAITLRMLSPSDAQSQGRIQTATHQGFLNLPVDQ